MKFRARWVKAGIFMVAFICLAVVLVRCTSTSADGNPLTGFQLVDASSQTVLAGLTDNASIELYNPDNGAYGIQVNVSSSVGSVRMELSGAKSVERTENIAPYSIYGDYEVDGTRKLNGEPLPTGEYVLTATAYSGSGMSGNNLGTMSVSFEITSDDANVWSATLNVKKNGNSLGCYNHNSAGCDNTDVLVGGDDFSFEGSDYDIYSIYSTPGRLFFYTTEDLEWNTDALTLYVGSRSFKFWEARQSEQYSREWQIGGSLWREGDVVSLRLVDEGVPALPAVQNLQADVYWTEVHLSWDRLADRERFEKLCRVSRGNIQLITVSRFDASDDAGTFESIGEISFRRTDYIDSTVEFGKEYEYAVAMVCDGFDGQRMSDHQTISLSVADVPELTNVRVAVEPHGRISKIAYLSWDITSLPTSTSDVTYHFRSWVGNSPPPLSGIGFLIRKNPCDKDRVCEGWRVVDFDNSSKFWYEDIDGRYSSYMITPIVRGMDDITTLGVPVIKRAWP